MARGKVMARASKVKAKTTKPVIARSVDKTSSRKRLTSSITFTNEFAEQNASGEEETSAEGKIFGPETLRSPRRSIFSAQDGSTELLSPSTTTLYPPIRKFSDLYGHGHVLEDASAIFPQSETGQKRRASSSVEGISPKRVRFAEPTNDDEPFWDNEQLQPNYGEIDVQPCEDLSIAQRDLSLDDDFLTQPDFHLLNALSDVTETLSINQISSLFRILQKVTGDFAANFFAHTTQDDGKLVGVDMQDFPFEDLELKHHALYLTTLNVLDASTTDEVENQSHIKNTGWLKFFAHPNYRPFLVTAILSEWFTQRVFKDTAFGLSDKARKEMEEGVDKQYIYFDAFIRAKKRSAVVARYRKKKDADFWLEKASIDLADELMIVLAPMLPGFKPSDPYNECLSPQDAAQKDEIMAALIEVIRHCAALNLAVVRSGENGTIVRPANKLEKGNRFFHTAPMECINPSMCDLARDDTEAGKDEKLVVKMTCWPRMEAWVPHGLDKLEMSRVEHEERLKKLPFYLSAKMQRGDRLTAEELKEARDGFFWDRSEVEAHWDILPVELHSIDKKNREKQDMLRRSHEAQRKYERAQRKKDGDGDDSDASDSGSSASSDSSSSSSESDDDTIASATKKEEDAPRGSWVTEYVCLAPHQVYCEWAKPESRSAAGANYGPNGQPSKTSNSLQDAVRDARERLASPYSLLANTDDLLLKLWNFYASHNLAIEWGTFLVAVLVYISRSGNAASVMTVPVKITARIFDGVCEVLGIKALSRGVISLASHMAHGIPTTGSGQHPGHFNVPISVLDNASTYLDNNLSVFKTVLWNVVSPLKGAFSTATDQGKIGFSDGFATMTHFVGQRRAFTTNPIGELRSLKSAVSSAVSQPSITLGPAAAASLASVAAAAAATARIAPPAKVDTNSWSRTFGLSPFDPVPVPVVSVFSTADTSLIEGESSEEMLTITETSTVYATPTTTSEHQTPSFWHAAASKAANVAGDFFLGTGRRGATTITLQPGGTTTMMMAQNDYRVV